MPKQLDFDKLLEQVGFIEEEAQNLLDDLNLGKRKDHEEIVELIEQLDALDKIKDLIRAEAQRVAENIADEESAPVSP